MHFSRRTFLKSLGALSFVLSGCARTKKQPPNFIIIFCDDLGYGDIGCFGSTKHRTPNIDQMAREGRKFTSFYVTSGVCTPSRSSLMTGCYSQRVNMHQNAKPPGKSQMRQVLFPVAHRGLNPNEITIAEILKDKGYSTACIGKWHLGDQPEYLPTKQGFDYYYGIPYSNDMGTRQFPINPPLPLIQNEKVIEAPVDQTTLTKRYTEQVIEFIKQNQDKPFFIYLPHTMPHNPVNASEAFLGTSANVTYGDSVEEIDWSTGKILSKLKELNLEKNTLVIFTSDNGAASRWGGSNLPLSGFKASTMEGGMRVPCVMWWPDQISANTECKEMAITMDLLPTLAKLAGTVPPQDRIIDGKNIWPLISGIKNTKTPHKVFYYYKIEQLQAVRSGKWKLHLARNDYKIHIHKPGDKQTDYQLYDLENDIAEKNNVAEQYPEIVEKLKHYAAAAIKDLGDTDKKAANAREAGFVVSPKPLVM